ncbi:unnamed protein product [Trichobilharzia regenti]|nr:unnamed protein product [Trichobilharzia regenti]
MCILGYEICQSPYYSQLNDDCDVSNENSKNNIKNNNNNNGSGKGNPYGELIITTNTTAITPVAMTTKPTTTTGVATTMTVTTLPTDISNMPPSCGDGCAGVNNNFPCECHSGKQQATSQMPGNHGDCCVCSCTTLSSHLYAQVLPRKRSVTDPETMSNYTIYSSNYIRKLNNFNICTGLLSLLFVFPID